ncbi:PREDICTED: protein AF-17 isoform X2 [Nanorana parkeri]|uniref:protein AF-17 isoform X2 n=1 Tax=Nanorana parkeri TaxID=125878 RepID=UPI0008541ABD|nr:PREDICTED: protein AF-17 isoform X2 [Nanorana parkeri]
MRSVLNRSAVWPRGECRIHGRMKEMVGGCCVCSDERGWAENPLVYCDGHGCNVAVHQACYGIVQVPTGPWFCRKCESQERAARVRCDLCPHKEGALKRTDNGGWAHVVCALYIPEVQFANVLTMEPIVLQYVPHDRFNKTCYICEEQGRESRAASGACMTCNRHGCRQAFHVTCAQMAGLLCEEEAQEVDNVKYIGYCKYHFNKMVRDPQKVSRLPCPIIPGRCSRSDSPSMEKTLYYKERQKKSHKDRERVRHRKHRDSPGHITAPPLLPISVEKHEISADSPEVTRSELKGKKPYEHRGRKIGSGKNASGASGASSTGSVSSPPDLVTFPKLEEQEEEEEDDEEEDDDDAGRSSRPTPSSPPELTFSSFGSIMRFSSESLTHARPWDTSSGEARQQKWSRDGTEPPREKKRKGSQKSRHGPGRPRGSKNNPPHSMSSSSLPLPPRHYTHQSALHSVSMESSLLSSGIYTSNKDPISVRTACSTPIPSSILSHQTSLPPYSRACSITPSSTASTTQVFSLPGSTFSIPSSHIFGSPLSMPPLLSQTESNRTEPEIEDCSFVCSGSSPRESLSSMSPISSLPPLFDSSGPSNSDNVPQITANLEQLLEKHGEAGVNIVDMLQALHSLQKENRSLQDQILTLTARKEKLQLLNVQLACPFPPSLPPTNISNLSSQDSFSNKSPSSKGSFRMENSPSEDPHSGCPSRSSSCLSHHSTPPPGPLSQTAPSLPAMGAEQLMNGLIRAAVPGAPSTLAALPLLGALSGNPGMLSLNSIMGNINGSLQGTLGQAHNPLCSGTASTHIPASLSPLNTLSEQQRQLAQQLQQITTAHLTVDQQNVLYQIVQHLQQRRDLQRLMTPPAPPLLPVTSTCSTMASSPTPPILTAQAPPFLGSQGERGGEKTPTNHDKG